MLLWLLVTSVTLTSFAGVALLLYMRKRQQEQQAQLKPVRVKAHREY